MKTLLHHLGRRQRLPMILQGQVAECGLAVIAMIAHYHGNRTGMGELRRRFLMSRTGSSLSTLVKIAQGLQLETRALKLDMDALEELSLPCVLHWDLDHFVVLKHVGARVIEIHDPAVGARRLTHEEFGKHFTGIALELAPAPTFQAMPASPAPRLSSLFGHVRGLRRNGVQILFLALALEIVSLAMPFQLQWVVDQGLMSADLDLIGALGVGFLLLVLLQAGIGMLRGSLIAALSTQLIFEWLGQVFAHLLKLPLVYFEKRHLGGIQSRFASIAHIQQTLTTGFLQAMVDGVLVVGAFSLMLLYSVTLSMVAGSAVLLYAGIRALLFHPLRDASAEEISWDAKQHTHFLESVRGIQAVRLFGRGNERRMGWMNLLAEQFNAELRIKRLGVIQSSATLLIFGCERVIVIWLAALAVLRNDMSLGMLFAFMAYKEQFSLRMAAFIDKLSDLRMLRLHAERVADIVHTEIENADESSHDMGPLESGIELQDVCFRYAQGEPETVSQVSLSIAPGECVAITGASGCGKTTLVKLILGLFEPTTGEVRVGGHPLRRVGLARYRATVGTVMQDDTLYSGSVADNISFFDPEPDQARIEHCALMAAVHEDIDDMPMGYASRISDAGTGLSGGQRQRLLLARALYKSPRILVLDEATSHLDSANERSVNQAIRGMKLTRIIVAHRVETIRTTDRVITLEKGRLVGDCPIDEWCQAQKLNAASQE